MGSWQSTWNCQKPLPISLCHKRVVWCQWWPTHWSVHFPIMSEMWYLCQHFARWTASTLKRMFVYKHNDRCSTSMLEYHLISVRSSGSIWTQKSQTDGLAVAVHNWPPRSQDLNALDYHVWGYMKAMVCAQNVNTREQLQQILSTASSINNTAVFHKVTNSLVTWVRKCMQTDGGHFEQLAWVLNGESVTVHLTIYIN